MGNSEKLCDAYVVYIRADCRPPSLYIAKQCEMSGQQKTLHCLKKKFRSLKRNHGVMPCLEAYREVPDDSGC